MKPVTVITKQYFQEILSDAMLVAVLLAPILMGLMFRFGIPALEGYLCSLTNKTSLIAPYYFLLDELMCIATPIMFAFTGVMVILSEADLGITRAIAVTPVGKDGYLFSRIVLPAVASSVYGLFITILFRISGMSLAIIALLSLLSAPMGIAISMMVVSLAKNKVEGMALTKMSGLMIMGLPAAVFVPAPLQYLAGIFPSFWMTKMIITENYLFLLPIVFVTAAWILFFWKRFRNKVLS